MPLIQPAGVGNVSARAAQEGIGAAAVAALAPQLCADSIRYSTSTGSGHPTSSMSAADVIAVLVGRHLRYDWDNAGDDVNDHLIFSKGHASPLLYSVSRAVGVVSHEEQMTGYRRSGSRACRAPRSSPALTAAATGGRFVVAEDHHPEGGRGGHQRVHRGGSQQAARDAMTARAAPSPARHAAAAMGLPDATTARAPRH